MPQSNYTVRNQRQSWSAPVSPRQTLPADRQLDVQYEDRIGDPAGTVRMVCQRFGISCDAEAEDAVAGYVRQNSRQRSARGRDSTSSASP